MAFQNRDNNNRREAPRAAPFKRKKLVPGGPAIDYKNLEDLRKFTTSSSKLMSRKRTGLTAQEQSDLKNAIKYARFMSLIPYTGAHH